MSQENIFVRIAACLIAGLFILGVCLAGDAIILTNGYLIDGTGGPVLENQVIVIRDKKIEKVIPGPYLETEGRVIDLEGRYVLPGLIDSHTHLDSPEAAGRALQSGVTTARVLGSPYFRSLGTRDLIRKGKVPDRQSPLVFTVSNMEPI